MTVEMISIRHHEMQRIAPCGAELATGRQRPLVGAPLYGRIEQQLRDDELKPWNLPLHEYECKIERDDPGGVLVGVFISRSQESLTATFTHFESGAKIIVSCIWVNDDGDIVQIGSNYGDLTL